MNLLRGGLLAGLSLASVVLGSTPVLAATTPSAGAPDGTPQLLTELQFNSAASSVPNVPGWTFGAQNGGAISVVATPGPTGATVDALEGSYPDPAPLGGQYIWAD